MKAGLIALGLWLPWRTRAQGIAGQGTVVFDVSTDNASWSSAIAVTPGMSVYVRARAAWQTTATVHGFAVVAFEEINFDGANASDMMTVIDASSAALSNGTLYKVQAFSQAWNVYDGDWPQAGLGDEPGDDGAHLFGQAAARDLEPNPRYTTDNPFFALVYRFVAGDAGRAITISGRWFRHAIPSVLGNQFVVYTNQNGTNVKFANDAAQVAANVHIVPGPGVGAMAIGVVMMGGRRRSR